MKKETLLIGLLLVTLGGCGEDDEKVTETPNSDILTEDGGDGEDATVPDTGEPGEIPDCAFKPPVGASCNPYPGCPGSGCANGEICTLVLEGEFKRIQCQPAGEAPLGNPCDLTTGVLCEEGVCVDGECRSFCVDNPDCGNNASCQQLPGVPGKPTVCGASQSDCDVLDAANSCSAGKACYLKNDGTTDCLDVQQAGQQDNACECINCCAPGFTCVTHEGQQLCGKTCAMDEATPTCQEACQGMSTKTLTQSVGVCVPAGEQQPEPDPIPCDILAQDCAGAAQACYPTNDGDQCLIAGNKPAGESCEGVNECALGLTCYASKCKAICDPAEAFHSQCENEQSQCPPLGSGAGGYCDE